MTLPRYKNRKGLRQRLEEFFTANPDEELSYQDIAVKFNTTLPRAYNVVAESPNMERVTVVRAIARKEITG